MESLNLSQLHLFIEIAIVDCCLDGDYNETVFNQLKDGGLVEGDVRKCKLTEKGQTVLNLLWTAANLGIKHIK